MRYKSVKHNVKYYMYLQCVTFIKFDTMQNILFKLYRLPLVGAAVDKCSVLYRFYGLL